MKTITAGLAAHYALDATTIATCWKITRQDATVFRFTDHDSNLVVPADGTYLASTGYTASDVETNNAMSVDNLEVNGWLDADAITEADLLAGLWDLAEVRIFEVNYADLSLGALKVRRGWLGEVRTAGTAFTAELRGMMQSLQQNIGRIVSPACDADLYDARCQVNPAAFTVGGAITAATSTIQFDVGALAGLHPDNYFDGGVVEFLTGDCAGLRMEMSYYTGATATIVLKLPMSRTITAGDTVSFSAGCDKRITTCRDKFSNVVNFRGFPHVPGPSRITSGT